MKFWQVIFITCLIPGLLSLPAPLPRAVEAGGTVTYTLRLFPTDLPHPVDLSAVSSSPNLEFSFSPPALSGPELASLTVSDPPGDPSTPGMWYTILLTGTGAGFDHTIDLRLLLGGVQLYLPLVSR